MKRAFRTMVIVYVLAGLAGLLKESRGELRCECNDDCWCKKPGLSLFRWVFPVGHSLPK